MRREFRIYELLSGAFWMVVLAATDGFTGLSVRPRFLDAVGMLELACSKSEIQRDVLPYGPVQAWMNNACGKGVLLSDISAE